MHRHKLAEGVVEDHPLLHGLDRFLAKESISPSWIKFLSRRVFFVYPKTAWIKLGVERPDEIKLRHELDSRIVGDALNKWLWRSDGFRNVVFDVRGVTILDRDGILEFFARVKKQDCPAFLLASEDAGTTFFARQSSPGLLVFHSESDLLRHLRSRAMERQCRVVLPPRLTLLSLDQALRDQAKVANLYDCDVVSFDMSNIASIDFDSASMLSPIIHSIAHKHGVLSSIENPKPKIARLIKKYGALRVMASYLVKGAELAGETNGMNQSGVSMKSFTDAETLDIQDLCLETLNALLTRYIFWFAARAGISDTSSQIRIERVAQLIKDFRQIVKELVENVAMHAQGLGYLMMELDPATNEGLKIYIGDTGIGLTKGISRAYRLRIRSDTEAVKIILRMKEYLPRRKRTRGPCVSGGRGLERVSLLLEKFSGQLLVRTGCAMAAFAPNEGRDPIHVFPKMYFVQGTHLHIFIPSPKEPDAKA